MNWEALGAIGEIVGAAAVVITLLYLAIQTRKNAQALDATSSREFAYRLSEWHREVARDPELKRIMSKSVKPEFEDYTDDEWLEFRFLAVSFFRILETGYIHMNLELGNREESENHIASAKSVIDTFPAWHKFWEEESSTRAFTQGFIDAVNSSSNAGDFRSLISSKEAG